MSLTRRFALNVLGGYLSIAAIFAIDFFLLPFLLNAFGTDRYGVWDIASSLARITVLFDLGFLAAIRRFQSKAMAENDPDQVNEVLGVSLRIYSFLGLLAGLACISTIFWLPASMNIPQEYADEFPFLMCMMGVFTTLQFTRAAFTGIVFGANRLDIDKLLTMLQRLVFAVLAVVLILFWRTDLISSGIALASASVFVVIGTYLSAKRLFPPMRLNRGGLKSPVFRSMLRFGSMAMVLAFGTIAMQQVPKLLVGHWLGVGAVAVFAVPLKLVGQMNQPIRTLALPMFPMASKLASDERHGDMAELYVRGSRLCLILGLAMGVPLVVFGESFLVLWTRKPEFGWTWQVLAALLAGEIFMFGQIPAYHLLAAGKSIRGLAFCNGARAVVALALMVVFLGLTDWGILGAAVAMSIGTFVFCGVLLPVLTCPKVGIGLGQYWLRSHGRVVIPAAILAAGCLAFQRVWRPDSLGMAVLELFVAGLIGLGLFGLLALDTTDRARIRRLVPGSRKG